MENLITQNAQEQISKQNILDKLWDRIEQNLTEKWIKTFSTVCLLSCITVMTSYFYGDDFYTHFVLSGFSLYFYYSVFFYKQIKK